MRIVIIDNYDSFTYNLFQYLGELDAQPLVFRNDEVTLTEIEKLKPDGVVISPGPGNPEDKRYFGICLELLRNLSPRLPTLGVCLGHQGIGVAFGGKIIQARELRHGKTSTILHQGKGLFKGIPNRFLGARYHSLVLDEESLSPDLEVVARSTNGTVMGLRHRDYPIHGIQFHPESILTQYGKEILENFLAEVKDATEND